MIKDHLSIYFIFTVFFSRFTNIFYLNCSLRTHSLRSRRLGERHARGRHAETPVLSCTHYFQAPATQAKNTRNGVSGGACRLTPPVAARSLSLDANTSFLKKVVQSVSVLIYLFRYIVFFFKVNSGIQYQTFYKS